MGKASRPNCIEDAPSAQLRSKRKSVGIAKQPHTVQTPTPVDHFSELVDSTLSEQEFLTLASRALVPLRFYSEEEAQRTKRIIALAEKHQVQLLWTTHPYPWHAARNNATDQQFVVLTHISDEDKEIAALHEIGHIASGHLSSAESTVNAVLNAIFKSKYHARALNQEAEAWQWVRDNVKHLDKDNLDANVSNALATYLLSALEDNANPILPDGSSDFWKLLSLSDEFRPHGINNQRIEHLQKRLRFSVEHKHIKTLQQALQTLDIPEDRKQALQR